MIPRMIRSRSLVSAVFAVTLLAAFSALSCSYTGRDKVMLKFPEVHGGLTNGLRVIVLPDPSTPLVQVDV